MPAQAKTLLCGQKNAAALLGQGAGYLRRIRPGKGHSFGATPHSIYLREAACAAPGVPLLCPPLMGGHTASPPCPYPIGSRDAMHRVSTAVRTRGCSGMGRLEPAL